MKIFSFKEGYLELDEPNILLVNEFKELWDYKRNKKGKWKKGDFSGYNRNRAFAEFTYIFLMSDWKSPYANYSEEEKQRAAFIDSGLDSSDIDSEVIAAMKKYEEIQDTRTLKLLKSAYRAVDELRNFFDTVNLQEFDEQGRPVHSSNILMRNLKDLGDLVKSLESLENKVKKELEEETGIRGDNERGRL